MKNLILSLAAIATLIGLSLTGCKKDNTASTNNNVFSGDLNNAQNLELHALAYNDTLVMYYDTARVRWHNPFLMHYDRLYHMNDSLFSIMYNTFSSQVYQYGVTMRGYNTGGMMGGGGMMGSNLTNTGMMNYQWLRSDTTAMGGYYTSMMQLRVNHETYHHAIYYQ